VTDDAPGGSGGTAAAAESGTRPFRSVVDDLLKFYAASPGKGAPPAMTDAVSQALVMVLGSGLQATALDGIAAAQQAQARLFHDAVDRQQRASILALEATARCIKEILSVTAGGRDAPEAGEAGGER